MILIDDRIGSKHLQLLIPGSELTRLEAGDACWSGADGTLVGVEVKRLSDAVACMFTGRLADEQVPKLRSSYDVVYLVIEGVYRPCPQSGVLQSWQEFPSGKETKCGRWTDATSHGRQRLMFSSFVSWMSSIEILGGLRVRNTVSPESTAALLSSMYSWWQRDLGEHRSFDVMHEGNGAAMTRPQLVRRMAALLPGIGWVKSAAVERRFKTPDRMVNSDRGEWMEIDGIGPTIADRVVRALHDAE